MSLIRFKTRTELGFLPGAAGGRSHFRVFESKECVEFSITQNSYRSCTLTAEDGSAAPLVGRESFEILPEDFALYRFTRNISLFFGIYDYGMDHWIYDIGSRRYPEGSVHAFRVFHGAPVSGNFTHYQNPDGQIIPDVCNLSLERVTAPSSPKEKSTDKKSKRILEAFPAPVPGIRSGNSWHCPETFDSLRIVWDSGACSQLFDCSDTPVAYLRLAEGDGRRYDKLYYRCSFFGIPKLVKV